MDYPKLISEKWNLTAKFNCLEAIYIYAPSALAVPMCALGCHVTKAFKHIQNAILRYHSQLHEIKTRSLVLLLLQFWRHLALGGGGGNVALRSSMHIDCSFHFLYINKISSEFVFFLPQISYSTNVNL